MIAEIKNAAKNNHGNAVIYGTMIGLILSDILPTPADAWYFSIQKKLRDKWRRGEINSKQYWIREALAYYGLNPIWWALVAGVTISIKGDSRTKLKVALWLIGITAVSGILLKNINEDIKEDKLSNPDEVISMPEKDFKVSDLKNKLERMNYTLIEKAPKIGNK